jgi:translation initiation factor RLI1
MRPTLLHLPASHCALDVVFVPRSPFGAIQIVNMLGKFENDMVHRHSANQFRLHKLCTCGTTLCT